MEFLAEMVVLMFWGSIIACLWALMTRRARQDAELRRTNPELWLRMKELESAEKQRQHERTQAGVKAGTSIATWLLKIFLK